MKVKISKSETIVKKVLPSYFFSQAKSYLRKRCDMNKNILVYSVLLMFVLIGGWLRLKGVVDGSFSFTYDVGRDMLAVENIVKYYDLTLIGPTTGLEGLFYGPWWYYFLSLPFILSGGNPQGLALFIGVIGILCIPLGFLIGKRMGSEFYGLSCAGIISAAPFFVQTSSQIWNPNVIPFLMLMLLLCLFSIISNKKSSIKLWIMLGIIVALIIQMQIFSGVILAISLMLSLVVFLRKKIVNKRHLFFFLGILLVELPRILFELRNSFLMSKKILGIPTGSNNLFAYDLFERKNFIEIQSVFVKLWSDTTANGDQGISFLILAVLILIILIYFKKTFLFERFVLLLTLIFCFTSIAVFIFISDALWLHYLIGLPIFFVLSASISLRLLQKYFVWPKAGYFLALAIIWFNLDPITIFAQSNKPLWEGNEAVYRNHIAVVDYIYKQSENKEFKYVLYTPPVHDYTYKYLFSWYGGNKYKKLPDDTNAKLLFLIVEPDLDYYHRRLDWLKERSEDGKLIKQERVIGNIVVYTKTLED